MWKRESAPVRIRAKRGKRRRRANAVDNGGAVRDDGAAAGKMRRRVGGAGKDKTPEGAIPTGVLLNELAWQ